MNTAVPSPIRVDRPALESVPVPPRDWLWEMLSPEGRQKLADTYRQFPHLRPQAKKPLEVPASSG